MQICIGLFFLVLGGCTIFTVNLYHEQVERRNQLLSASSDALSKWREISYALLARGFESADLLSPTQSNKIVGDVIEALKAEDERLGIFATAVNDAYLESLTTKSDLRELQNTAADNSCTYAFDGECDEPTLCSIGTDSADCN